MGRLGEGAQQHIVHRARQGRLALVRGRGRIGAGSLMGTVQIGRLSILGGLRVERTKTEGEGALQAITPEERARRAAFVGPLNDAEITRRTLAEYSGRPVRRGA